MIIEPNDSASDKHPFQCQNTNDISDSFSSFLETCCG